MDEQRLQAYLTLINTLLTCPSGEEGQTLQDNAEFVDAGLVETMTQKAEALAEEGDENAAQFLVGLANQLGEFLGLSASTATPEAQLDFLLEVLQATLDSRGNPQVVYPLLKDNLHLLNENFTRVLWNWGMATLTEVEAEQGQVLGEFSNLIVEFPLGSQANNLEIAIAGYEMALTTFTCDNDSETWAILQNNLGNAYRDRIRGKGAENIERAIASYQAALKVRTRKAFPSDWAMTQNNLGNAYWKRIRGEAAENIERAIASYQAALEVYTLEAFPNYWADTQNNLGAAYCKRIRGEAAENIERAIASYQAALEVYTYEAFPTDWAEIQNNLGNAYKDRIRGDKAENIEIAITSYQAALEVRTRKDFPRQWAMTQNNLGIAYSDKIGGEAAENIEIAIASYQAALEVRTRKDFPKDWAETQNNLGNTYKNRIRGERAENIEIAIASYQAALQVHTREAFSSDWAMTQNNLGLAYSDRIRGEKAENIERAIASYQAALGVYTREAFPSQWAMTQNNLGIAYSNRIRGETTENIESAIASYQAALEVYTREAFPSQWATTQNNLGNSYLKRIWGERTENIEIAIASYQAALEVHTREAFPHNWAMMQNNLAEAYRNRIWGKRAENIESAIASYQAALEVYTREAFPQNHAETQFNLGLVYRDAQQLDNAYHAFAAAIDTVEFQRVEISLGTANDADKQKLAEEWNKLYRNMMEVCLELADNIQAWEYIERSKTRNLIDNLTSRSLYPDGQISTQRQAELQQLQEEIWNEQRRLNQLQAAREQKLSEKSITVEEIDYSHINQLRQRYNELYPYKPLKFDQLSKLIDKNTAIIEWYIFNDCFRAVIINDLTPQPPSLQDTAGELEKPNPPAPFPAREGGASKPLSSQERGLERGFPSIWTSTAEDLANLETWAKDYLQAYDAPRLAETDTEAEQLKQDWQTSLPSRLNQLAEILHINDLLTHIPETCTQLILIPHLYLHLFPLHALNLFPRFPDGIRYLPSCQLLHQLQQQKRPDFQRLFAIQTPTSDLYEKDLGAVSAIKTQFSPVDSLKKDKASKSALLSSRETIEAANCLLFFCHGYFNFRSPLDSGLELADANLTLEDIIAHFRLSNCRLVTLSACETGISEIKRSDEYISLPYGFLLAGSTNVFSSLWTVSAFATALLIVKFYQELQHQENLALALKTAQCWLRDTTVKGFQDWLANSPFSTTWQIELKKYFQKRETEQGETAQPFNNPYYWAAFCLIGKGV
ncbi:MAG: tetratricopeptide repeat protein [Coleofasciculus sp. C1-SOL-03]|uniref:CHAT domain-containing protein n=1 Tax=Coleofasciculus sp. C1-SOL-03 TaxID=3069522 RepID=UPI0032F3ED2D